MKRALLVGLIAAVGLSSCFVPVRAPGYGYGYYGYSAVPGPGPGYWVAGHWYRSGGRYQWRPGYWDHRAVHGRYYRDGHYWR
jgi:hypothetical protein